MSVPAKALLARNAAGDQVLLDGIPVSGEVEIFLAGEDERLRELAEAAFATNTRRAYKSDWDSFVTWAFSRDFVPLPATPDTVARYLRWLVDRPRKAIEEKYTREQRSADGRPPNKIVVKRKRLQKGAATSTVARHLVSIGKAHAAAGFSDPTATVYVQTIWKGLRRQRGVKKTAKEALKRETLLKVLPAILPEDGPKAGRLLALRNRAILLVAFSGAFRRSEVADIDVEHIEYDDRGVAITLPRSKTDQDGEHEVVLIPFAVTPELCAVRAVDEWRAVAEIEEGPVFRALDRHGNVRDRIQGALVASVVKESIAAAKAADDAHAIAEGRPVDGELAKLNPKVFAAHSLRSGWISTAAREGHAEREMMAHSRHANVQIFRGYVQRATRWDGHPVLGLL
jgi:integrase